MWTTTASTHLGDRWSLVLALLPALFAPACQRVQAQATENPLAPVGCFEIVDDKGLASSAAIDLCTSATSVAPGLCYEAAIDRHGDLTTSQIIQLCRAATSTEPVNCYTRLDARGELTNDQIIRYCATRCAMGPAPPQASSADCLAAALDRTDLTRQMAEELCTRSRSAGPVDCFVAGRNVTNLSHGQLVGLCAQTFSCQYVNTPPE